MTERALGPRRRAVILRSVAAALVVSAAARADRGTDTPPPSAPVAASERIARQGDDSARLPELELALPADLEEPRTRAIRSGLNWLAQRQDPRDGSVRVDDADDGQRAPVAVTALAALAWMSAGSTPSRGPHQDELERAVEYLLGCTRGRADEHPGYITGSGDRISRTHGHGLATLALAEAYTVSPASPLGKRIGAALEAAVRRIEISQGAEGGWYYEPVRTLEH
ncbi:MAG: hypothetical protein AAFP86_17255, partial [Planctomycetota bacterium]